MDKAKGDTEEDYLESEEEKMGGGAQLPAEDQLVEYAKSQQEGKKEKCLVTTGSGAPIGCRDATQTVGPRGPALLQDVNFLDELAHFDRERIPERVVHAKGAGAFGYFEVTHDITKYCAAKVFEKVGKRTPIAVRFSTVGGESGSADTVRDPRGFAVKFYTEDGIWDLVGNNTPIFFIRDPILFPSFIHTQKRNPATHLKDANMFWDFLTLRPESTHQHSKDVDYIRSSSGVPVGCYDASLTVGPFGLIALQDNQLIDELAHLNRERIPERVVHAKGAGALGYFKVTHDITKYCAAKVFEKVGKRTPIAVRCSTTAGQSGSAETVRNVRGFAIKFYTEDGIWDLVGNNSPIFFIRDPMLFPSLVHSTKRHPVTNLHNPNMFWDFLTLRPETTHQIFLLFGDRGIPDGYRHMHGFGSHTFKLVNKENETFYCKFHWLTRQGVRNLDVKKAGKLAGTDPDYATRDLFNAIAKKEYPKWCLQMQIMDCQQAKNCKFNPFDLTKVWPHKKYPLIKIGKIKLNHNPRNYFADIEQIAFSPSNFVPGIDASPDRVLQARLFAYPDAQRYRLGANHKLLPINHPKGICVRNFQRDGKMNFTCNFDGAANYWPNSCEQLKTHDKINSLKAPDYYCDHLDRYRNGDAEDNYSQVTDFWKIISDEEKDRLIKNICNDLGNANETIIKRALKSYCNIHPDVAKKMKECLKMD